MLLVQYLTIPLLHLQSPMAPAVPVAVDLRYRNYTTEVIYRRLVQRFWLDLVC